MTVAANRCPKPWLAALLLGLAAMLPAVQGQAVGAPAPAAGPPPATAVPVLRVGGPIGPATADFIDRHLHKAALERAPLLVLQIDTPGGLDSSTRQIVKALLASPVPVAAWVAPSGARAASAGAYIVYASHVAAMAPGTNLGAATPVQIGGLPGARSPAPPAPGGAENAASAPSDPTDVVRPGSESMNRKIVNDSAAYLRALAQLRGRNADWADRAVRDGASLAAAEAQARRVIDFLAADLDTLLAQSHGRTVQMADGSTRTLNTQGAVGVAVESDWRTRLLSIITDPTIAYLLLLLGIYGIYFELTSPGFGIPGVAGAIALLLGLFALQMLPVSYAGVALIVLGFALLVAEALMPSFGALGIGGVIAFVIGSIMLIDTDTPGFGIPLGLIASAAVVNVLFVLIVLRMALKARARPVVSGAEEMQGARAEVLEVDATGGWARVHGERWRVRSSTPLHVGQRLRVSARDGLVLNVDADRDGAP